MSHRTHIHELESDFAEAMAQMYAVGNGLARLRAELDRESSTATEKPSVQPSVRMPSTARPEGAAPLPAAPTPTATAASTPTATAAPTPTATVAPAAGPATGTASQPGSAPSAPIAAPLLPGPPIAFGSLVAGSAVPPHVPWYRKEGAVTWVLAVAGAVVTMAGVAMLLVLAVQQGWFGPQARVAAGAALAAVLVGLGARSGEAERRSRPAVGSAPVALVATGTAAAYLDVVAITSIYGWVPPGVGLGLAGVVALAGLHLARRWDSELLAVLMVLGAAVLAPVVAQGGGWLVSAYLGILCLAGWWAGGTRTRPFLTLARVVPVTLALLVGAVGAPRGGPDEAGLLAVAGVVLAATLATSAISVRRDRGDLSASAAVALLAVGLLANTAPLAESARTLTLALSAAALLLTATTLGRRPLGPLASHLVVTIAVAGTVFSVLAVISGAPERFTTTGLLLLALIGLTVAGVTRSLVNLALAAGVAAVALLAWTTHPLAVVTASGAAGHDMVAALVDSVLVGGVVAVGLWALANQRGVGRDVRLWATVLAWVFGLAASATALVAVGTLLGIRLGDATLGFTIGHAVATVTWMLAAAWLLLRGLERSRDADLTLRTGLLLVGVSVAKLFLYDLAALSGIVRSVAFIATGLLLLATGSRYAKAYERSRLSA